MYAIGFVNGGSCGMVWQAGNNGMMRLYHKSMYYIMNDTELFRKLNDEVYIINDLTQEMCEMNNAKFYNAVVRCGKRIK